MFIIGYGDIIGYDEDTMRMSWEKLDIPELSHRVSVCGVSSPMMNDIIQL